MKLGKTIVADREEVQTESERMAFRAKEKRRKHFTLAIVIGAFLIIIAAVSLVIYDLVENNQQPAVAPVKQYQPTVEIIDEAGSNYITEKMRQYVGKIERDMYDLGSKVTKAIIPAGKTREIDIYLDGREEYYKCNLDRGTAETAEDIARVEKYLSLNNLLPKYVDVRVEGRAFYL